MPHAQAVRPAGRAFLQRKQAPQAMSNAATTRSQTLMSFTAMPTSTTVPMNCAHSLLGLGAC